MQEQESLVKILFGRHVLLCKYAILITSLELFDYLTCITFNDILTQGKETVNNRN